MRTYRLLPRAGLLATLLVGTLGLCLALASLASANGSGLVSETKSLISANNMWPKYLERVSLLRQIQAGTDFNPATEAPDFRLSYLAEMIADPLQFPAWADKTTNELRSALPDQPHGLAQLVLTGARLLEHEPEQSEECAATVSNIEGLAVLLEGVGRLRDEALRDLTTDEVVKLNAALNEAYISLDSTDGQYHRFADRHAGAARDILDLAQKVRFSRMFAAAARLAEVADARILERLEASLSGGLQQDEDARVPGVTGPVVAVYNTPVGQVIVGGRGANTYCNVKAAAIVDLGGDDQYLGKCAASGPDQPVSLVIDYSGDDTYVCYGPFAQACGLLGCALLIDRGGNDTYASSSAGQGAGVFGVGLLLDEKGNDTYIGHKVCQGAALFGLGTLVDREGNDRYDAALFAQGLGHTQGLGLLADLEGDDRYTAGGYYVDGYGDRPDHYDAWSQGMGSGLRGYADGGIGIILEGAGNDVYTADQFCQAMGYWWGIGIMHDKSGDDIYRAPDGRWSQGIGCHFGLGILLDDEGADESSAGLAAQGMGWDGGAGFYVDWAGNDLYSNRMSLHQGAGAEGGFGLLADWAGRDGYRGAGSAQGWGSPVTYPRVMLLEGSWGLLLDLGSEEDSYQGVEGRGDGVTLFGDHWGFFRDVSP